MPPTNDATRALLAPYVTNLDRPIYCLRNLPEEVVAVLFAYYSRSRESLRENLARLIQDQDLDLAGHGARAAEKEEALALAREKARQFHEKWVVGYGHASVAEHAVAHVAVEDVSILASKAIEDCRLASYTEKSTRYVVFEPGRCYRPTEAELPDRALRAEYQAAVEHLFHVYRRLIEPVEEAVRQRTDPLAFRTPAGYRAACRAQACDLLRYLLPAATFTNLGLTANARSLEHMLTKLLSHPLAEVRAVGEAIRREAQVVIPTLIKYASRNPYRAETPRAIAELARELLPAGGAAAGQRVRLLAYPPAEEAERRLAAAILYEQASLPWEAVRARVEALAPETRERVIETYLRNRGKWDAPLRALEHLSYTFEILVDYGAYRDIQRHRMCTQTDQLLTVEHGFELPEALVEYGLAEPCVAALERAAAAYGRLAEHDPHLAQYVVPLAYRKRVLVTWNLREIYHFTQLRSARQGHPSYRRVAQDVWRAILRVHPFLNSPQRAPAVDWEEYAVTRPG